MPPWTSETNSHRRRMADQLRPLERRGVWIVWGLALQVIGAGIPVTVALRRANRDGVLGSFTHYTIRLIWHEMLRSRADVALIIAGVIVFAIGTVVMARPFVRRRTALFTTVPALAVAGLMAFGVIALLVACVVALVQSPPGELNLGDLFNNLLGGWWMPGGRRNRRK